MEEQKIIHASNIKLSKGIAKENYGWEIRVADDELEKAVEEVERINNLMLSKFKKEGATKK